MATKHPQRQEDIFRRLMLLMLLALLEDLEEGTDNHQLFFSHTMEACLVSGIPPEHQEAVVTRWALLVQTLNIEEEKIRQRGISPN